MLGMTNHMQETLVLGGSGKTGRRVLERLGARGVPARAGSRSGEPPFDWDDRATWAPALRDVRAAYVSFYPDLAIPGASELVGAFARLAVERGVERLVLLSGRGEEEAQRSEQALLAAGAESTIVRASWFAQNFSEGFFLDAVLDGVVALPVGDMREPFVDAEDIADVAVAALTEGGHAGRLYEVTGPRLLTFAEAVAEIADATGRELRFVSLSIEEYTSALAQYELPEDVVALMGYLFTEVLDGRNAKLADGIRQALGRAPRDFGDYARDAAASGVWNAPRTAF
jgi:uncharacterized protein YbjT (DUF2867 family)